MVRSLVRAWLLGSLCLGLGGCPGWLVDADDGGRARKGRARASVDEVASVDSDDAAPSEDWEGGAEGRRKKRRLRDVVKDPGELEELEALGYVAEGNTADEGPTGVLVHEAGRPQPGTNLVVSAHAYEVQLLDLDGQELHRWSVAREALPGDAKVNGFRKAFLLPGGELLAVVEGQGIVRLSKDSEVLWSSDLPHHHDVHVEPDGTLHTLSREARTIRAFRDRPVVEDRIVVFSPDGSVKRELSVLKALSNSPYPELYEKARVAKADALHTNSIELLDGRAEGRNAAFAKGRYLLSSRTLSLVMVLDPETETVVWAQEGPWRFQHDPTVLDDGTVMVFDNASPGPSGAMTFDPANGKELWRWSGPPKHPIYTGCCGTAQRLPNGNTFVVVTDEGKAIEIDPEGKTVWLWQSPFRVGKKGQKIARLFDVVRTPPADALRWLDRKD